MKEIQFDEHCAKILLVLIVDKQQMHFNELHRTLIGKRITFSKPTLKKHLDHLREAGYVTRTPDKGQLVTYSLNLEKIGKAKEYAERVKRIAKSQYENKKEFFSRTEKEQVNMVLNYLSFKKLHETKARIEYLLDPKSFEKWFAVRFWMHPALELVFVWMIKRCVRDEAYRERILEIIDDILEK